jgi:signal transduction histidine kinase
MVAVELLLFLPAMQRERQKWLEGRLLAAQIAVQALPSAPGQPPPIAGPERAAREELLRLAGVLSVRLQEPGRPMVTLAPVGQIHAPALLDMRSESAWARLWATLSALTRSGDRLLLVVAPSPKRPQAVLSVVLREGELDDHLKEAAATVALHGLSVAIPTGILVHVTLLVLLVRPMRRLTQSIAAFRADPERTPPLEEPRAAQETRDEMVLAQRELAAMQRELRAALWRNARLAALGAALARVSHDLRGILAPALLSAERLQGNTDPALRRVGDSIARTVERATELVRNTLEFAGEVPAAPRERVALRDLVQEVAEEVRTRHPLLRVDVRVDAGLAAHGDRASLRRALANLIRNAAEAGARRVAVSAAAEGDLAVVTLEDDGPGLPEVVRSSLFQPFVTSGKKGGTGLGLAITRDLVRAQGGEIGLVRSTAEGSVFRLALRMPGSEAAEQRSAAG